MARLKENELERLKQEVSLLDLVQSYGVKLKKKGKDLIGLCPFHDDHSPSLVISPDKNLWHCMGACQEGGSVIDWVMKSEGVSLRHALEILKERENPNILGGDVKHIKKATVRKLDLPFDFDSDKPIEKQALLNQVIDFYHQTLKQNSEGMEYLQQRSLKNPEMIDRFKLGLCNRTLCYRLPARNRQAGKEIREKLIELGALRESGHEHFAGSLVIPIFDETGNVVEIYGRKLRNDLRKGTALHLYLPGPHKGVWNFSCLAAGKEIILCEALIDALTFWCYGFRNVTSSYGINGFTKEHLEEFKRFGTERVLIAYDRDDAGDHAAEILSQKLISEGINCSRILFPLGQDANQHAQQAQCPEKALNHVIQNAVSMGNGRKVFYINDIQVQKEAAKEEKEKEKPTTPASPAPALPAAGCDIANISAEIKPDGVIIQLEDRQWRIRGLSKNMSYEILRVNVRVSKAEKFFLDNIDLYSARQRFTFVKQAAEELEVDEDLIKKDLGKLLLKLEELQDEQIKQTLEPKNKEVVLDEKEKQEALALLKAPDLLDRILQDFKSCGVVGEETNKLVGYLAAVSRKLDSPLAILIQSSSAAGKTWLMESVLNFVPDEEKVKYSAMTGQSLFYMGETNLKHKILAIVEEEGAERTRYALKLLQSEGELSIASTGKDPVTGLLGTKEYRVEGPVMIFSTTTNIDIDEELQNRCIILTVDESREQTRAIHQMQREQRTFEGLRAKKEKKKILHLHRNAQRLLRPLFIINPYARRLTFLDDKTRTRRDHEKYLCMIDSIAFLHQYQRQIKITPYGDNGKPDETIIVTLDDIELANRLANEVLGRSLDELPPHTRNMLMIIDEMVEKECKKLKIERSEYRFSRRQVREYCGWGNSRLKIHFKRLEDLEYLIMHRGKRGLTFEYELLYDGKGKDGSLFLMGLIDIDKLRKSQKHPDSCKYEKNKSGLKAKIYEYESNKSGSKGQIYEYDGNKSGFLSHKSAPSQPQVSPKSGGGHGVLKPLVNKVLPFFLEKEPEKGI
jgi:DNA primase